MSTAGQVVDRLYRDFLFGGDAQPSRTRLDGSLDASTTAVVYVASLFAADEEDLLAPGVLAQVGYEQMLVTDVNTGTSTLTVVRGVNGTAAADHADAALVEVAPRWSRQGVLEAVADNVVALYPTLYRTDLETLTVTASYTEVPADIVTPVSLTSGDYPYMAVPFTFAGNFPQSSTGKAVITQLTTGTTAYLLYRAKFTRPATAAVDLVAATGLDASWERIVLIGAAAQLLAGAPEFDALTTEYITEQLAAETVRPGSASDVSTSLLRFHELLLDKAAKQLRVTTDPVVAWTAV